MAIGQNFPISEYYREGIVDAETINRSGLWWTAALRIKQPTTGKEFIAVYKFQRRNGDWKVKQKIHLNSSADATKLAEALARFAKHL